MVKRGKTTQKRGSSIGVSLLKALLTTVLLTVLLLAAEVLAVKLWMPQDRMIVIFNHAVRVLAIAGGSFVFCIHAPGKAWQRGLLLGGGYWLLLFLLHFTTVQQMATIAAMGLDAFFVLLTAVLCNALFSRPK